jgi:Bacteriocin-protection, YdeI or OmpD-Associated
VRRQQFAAVVAAADVAAALDAHPRAAAFFDSLAQFYRKAYLR